MLKRLLHTALLEEAGETGERMRLRERNTIVQALNILAELAFEPESGAAELTEQQIERRRRMIYQSALSYISDQIRARAFSVSVCGRTNSPIGCKFS